MKTKKVRLIARLDVKSENVVKGVQLEGLRVIGRPHDLANKYIAQGADELLYLDTVASLYGRNNLHDIVADTAKNVDIPITVGGGVRSLNDITSLLHVGADKIAINTYAAIRPEIICEAAKEFGSQCIVASITAKKNDPNSWTLWTDNAREPTNLDVIEHAKKYQELGAGEIIVTSIDQDGTRKGFDFELYQFLSEVLTIPLIAAGGAGSVGDIIELCENAIIDAVSLGTILHYNETQISAIKSNIGKLGIKTRKFDHRHSSIRINKKDCRVTVVDFGLGNLYSVMNSFESLGADVRVANKRAEIRDADRIVLLGVGAFYPAMQKLKSLGLDEEIINFCDSQRPILGICLGAQLLMDQSSEFGVHDGIGLISGNVIPIEKGDDSSLKVPHVGWSSLMHPGNKHFNKQDIPVWDAKILKGLPIGSEAYFVHSYKIVPNNYEEVVSICNYGGQEITAVVSRGYVFGCQFHPEKSGQVGIRILSNFCDM